MAAAAPAFNVSIPARAPAPVRLERSVVVEDYESQLAHARRSALTVAALHGLCRFLAYCSLTWATVVLLGGFVSVLAIQDFVVVTVLLLVEAARLASAIVDSKLVTRALVTLSQNPSLLTLQDAQPRRARAVRVASQVAQAACILPSLGLPVYRLATVRAAGNLLYSLNLFYALTLVNAVAALAAVACATGSIVRLFAGGEHSVRGYYDEILKRGFDDGLVDADEFDFLEFAYINLLGRAFARNVQPPTVQRQYRQLLTYLFFHRHGVEWLQICLDWPNVHVQQAAANVPGLWATVEGVPIQNLPRSLLTKLADKLGSGQVGWGAANSFCAIAEHCPPLVLRSVDTKGTPVLNTLKALVNPAENRSLVFVRALLGLVSVSRDELKNDADLIGKLNNMFEKSPIHRTRILVGHLLEKLGELNQSNHKSIVETIDPTNGDYIFESELEMLRNLRRIFDLEIASLEDETLSRNGLAALKERKRLAKEKVQKKREEIRRPKKKRKEKGKGEESKDTFIRRNVR